MNYQVVSGDATSPVMAVVGRVREQHHARLASASIAVVMVSGKTADADDRLWLGSLRRPGAGERELHAHDFVLSLNADAWEGFSDEQREALVDHELCHGMPVTDGNGVQERDDGGSLKWRTRRHDLEEFTEVVRRRGLWLAELETFAKAAAPHMAQPSLFGHRDITEPDEEPAP